MSKRRGKSSVSEHSELFSASQDHCVLAVFDDNESVCHPRLTATEVVAARGRLKGALQDIANVTEDESEADSSKPSRGRPPKRVKKESTPPPQPKVQHSFIMKLFDRCVDLAKYTEGTPLYPICRAWMLNQPKSSQLTK